MPMVGGTKYSYGAKGVAAAKAAAAKTGKPMTVAKGAKSAKAPSKRK